MSAHGHRVEQAKALPLVIDMKDVTKTKEAVKILQSAGVYADVEASEQSRRKRSGKGGYRNRRFVQKLGPLIVHAADDNVEKGFRVLPGVSMANVEKLNLLQLAPGGHPGRLIVWTLNAFKALDGVYQRKKGFHMPIPMTKQTDFTKFMEAQTAKRDQKPVYIKEKKVNPFACEAAMRRLNPAWGK